MGEAKKASHTDLVGHSFMAGQLRARNCGLMPFSMSPS